MKSHRHLGKLRSVYIHCTDGILYDDPIDEPTHIHGFHIPYIHGRLHDHHVNQPTHIHGAYIQYI